VLCKQSIKIGVENNVRELIAYLKWKFYGENEKWSYAIRERPGQSESGIAWFELCGVAKFGGEASMRAVRLKLKFESSRSKSN
jgi:hypothetical protein